MAGGRSINIYFKKEDDDIFHICEELKSKNLLGPTVTAALRAYFAKAPERELQLLAVIKNSAPNGIAPAPIQDLANRAQETGAQKEAREEIKVDIPDDQPIQWSQPPTTFNDVYTKFRSLKRDNEMIYPPEQNKEWLKALYGELIPVDFVYEKLIARAALDEKKNAKIDVPEALKTTVAQTHEIGLMDIMVVRGSEPEVQFKVIYDDFVKNSRSLNDMEWLRKYGPKVNMAQIKTLINRRMKLHFKTLEGTLDAC